MSHMNAPLPSAASRLTGRAPLTGESKWCRCCGRTYDVHEWLGLQLCGYVGAVRSGGKLRAVELRHCRCGSTIGVEVERQRDGSWLTAPSEAELEERDRLEDAARDDEDERYRAAHGHFGNDPW